MSTEQVGVQFSQCFLLAGLYCNTSSCSTCTASTLDNAMPCHRISEGKGGIGGRRREGICNPGQVRVGTCFALNEDEKYHVCEQFVIEFGRTCVREHQRSLGLGVERHARACVTSTIDLQRHYLKLAFNIPTETSNFRAIV